MATQVDLRGKAVLEVSCGHGGGASWISRHLGPASYIGLDLNPTGIRFCQERHRAVQGLSFRQGDAQALPFPDASMDAIINVEASHCYPDFPRFLAEVTRVLRPGGHFLYTDFRFSDAIPDWDSAMAASSLKVLQHREITPEVMRGMDTNGERSRKLIQQRLPGFLQPLGGDFAGLPGSFIYQAMQRGEVSYRSWCLQKQ